MEGGIAVAGNLIVDYMKIIDTYPKTGMLCNILERSQSVGGCVANTLGCLAVMDTEVPLYCHGCIGDDDAGRFIMDFLNRNRIDVGGVTTKPGQMTSFTDVMTVRGTGERTFFQTRGANAVFGPENLDYGRIGYCGIFHIGYALLLDRFDDRDKEYGTVMARTLAKVQSFGVKTSMDVVSEEGERFARVVGPCLKYCDYFIANEIEGGKVVGLDPRREDGTLDLVALKEICRRLMAWGVAELVVLHAPEGGIYRTKEGASGFVPSLKLPEGYIQGSVGAGDAFCAGILYSLYEEKSVQDAMVIANAAAAANLSTVDSVSGLRPIGQLMELVKQYGEKDPIQ